jgi:hypothetical protein
MLASLVGSKSNKFDKKKLYRCRSIKGGVVCFIEIIGFFLVLFGIKRLPGVLLEDVF